MWKAGKRDIVNEFPDVGELTRRCVCLSNSLVDRHDILRTTITDHDGSVSTEPRVGQLTWDALFVKSDFKYAFVRNGPRRRPTIVIACPRIHDSVTSGRGFVCVREFALPEEVNNPLPRLGIDEEARISWAFLLRIGNNTRCEFNEQGIVQDFRRAPDCNWTHGHPLNRWLVGSSWNYVDHRDSTSHQEPCPPALRDWSTPEICSREGVPGVPRGLDLP